MAEIENNGIMQEEEEPNITDVIAEKLNIQQARISRLQQNILLIAGDDKEGRLQQYICKKPRNSSPLLVNGQDRELLFYHHFSNDLSDSIPDLIGEIEGFEIFQYLESDGTVDPHGMLDVLPAIQKIEIPDSYSQIMAGEYDNEAQFLAYLNQICTSLEENLAYRELTTLIKNNEEAFSIMLEYLNNLPQVLTHGDFWHGNAIRANQKLYILDWENCQVNNNHYDLSTLLNTERLTAGNSEFQLPNQDSVDEIAIEYNFLLQTISQILPELLTDTPNTAWTKTWLQEFLRILDKHSTRR